MAKAKIEEPLTQSDADDGSRVGKRRVAEILVDCSPYMFYILFIFLLLVTIYPFRVFDLEKIANLVLVCGAVLIASGSVINSDLINHAERVIDSESRNPTRFVRRKEFLQLFHDVLQEAERGDSWKKISQGITKQLMEEKGKNPTLPTMISNKNIAESIIKISKRTYVGTIMVVIGSSILIIKLGSWSMYLHILHLH